ncbi:condensation domain-containing protein [Actinoplanes derwentensis]|uniref:Condensation domain-containing protein n=1 Tax=Actinoplanes derwentensis TaxID=113562 RepID=A0A1H2DDC2_9ACTN|nr:condensation domain-containing protein [Actinoplanes derwentensis]SDT80587.1 Condensation domain-containing protein [Actinoplanes derwentensis]
MGPLETVRLPLEDNASRSGPFSWAQLGITEGYLEEVDLPPEVRAKFDLHATLNLRGRWRSPAADVIETLRRIVNRHECFRTTVHDLLAERPNQKVNSVTTFPVVVSETCSGGSTEALRNELCGNLIDVRDPHLVRIGMANSQDVCESIVISASRMVVDGWGFSNLARNIMQEIGGKEEAHSPDFHQLDQVAWEDGAAGQARHIAAMAFREQVLEQLLAASIPSRPRLSPTHGYEARCEGSAITGLCERIAARYSTSPSSVLLAAFGHTVSRLLNQKKIGITLSYADRGDASRKSSVTRLKNEAIMAYADGDSFPCVLQKTFQSALSAYSRAGVDPVALRRAGVSAALHGAQDVRFEFNDARGPFHRNDRLHGTARPAHGADDRIGGPRVRTVIDGKPPRLGLWVGPSFSDFAGKTSLTVRTNILSREDTAAVLRGTIDVLRNQAV